MKIDIKYKSLKTSQKQYILALFVDDNLELNTFKNVFFKKNSLFSKNIIKTAKQLNLKKNIFELHLNLNQKIIFIKVKKDYSYSDFENLGAEFFNFLKINDTKKIFLDTELPINSIKKDPKLVSHFIHGIKLKSYEFNTYKKIKKENQLEILIPNKRNFEKNISKLNSIEKGVNFARDLVSEPPNVLFPREYVNRLLKLKKLGIKVTAYNEGKMKKLGMNSLLGVGQGSSKESFLVTLEWYGNKKDKKSPLSFVGKGVCFDTGGISLKPAKFMEEMKYDMAGSAVVAGLIKSLALRKAKVNAVGVVGLVENMPGGNAQRPGDIVKAYNGKTIEVLNTDAEGRLVLADALSFTEKKFKPKFIIDLATLTGAIIISLGEEYAGLFSNNDELSKKLYDTGEKVNEKVWRLPLHKNYDKLMDSTIADIQNINYSGGAGSITAAQFLQRFIDKTPWAHLDIAGMAFSKKAANLNPGGATGFGVRLLNQLIEDYYE